MDSSTRLQSAEEALGYFKARVAVEMELRQTLQEKVVEIQKVY